MQEKNARWYRRNEMNTRFIKILSLSLLVFAWLGACFTPTTMERPERERLASSRSPLRGTVLPPGTGQREVPSLSDLFGRFHEEEIRIALLLPLSGPGESLGNAFLDAAAMALFEAYDPRLHLFPLDTGGTPEGARRAALSAVAGEVDIVIGPLFADSIRAAAPVLREEDIKMIGFSNNPDVAGDGVYLLSFMPEQEVKRVIQFASDQDYGQFAALIPDSLYGAAVLEGFSEAVYLAGREITGLEIYTRDTQSFLEPVRRLANYDVRRDAYLEEETFLKNLGDDDFAEEILKNLETMETLGSPPFTSVIVPESGQFLRSLIPLLPFFEIDPVEVKFLGTGLWYDPTLAGEPTLEGAWFAGPDPEKVEGFMTRFQSLYGYRPLRIATLSFDAVSLVASLSRIEIRRARFSDRTLRNANGFSGIDGIFRFQADGTTERGFAILEIRKDGFHIVSPPPDHF